MNSSDALALRRALRRKFGDRAWALCRQLRSYVRDRDPSMKKAIEDGFKLLKQDAAAQ